MFAGLSPRQHPKRSDDGREEAGPDGAAMASLEPGKRCRSCCRAEDVKFSSPADVGGGYEASSMRTLLVCSPHWALPYHLVDWVLCARRHSTY